MYVQVNARMSNNIARLGNLAQTVTTSAIDVNVVSHKLQRYAVWFGGSMLGATVGGHCLHSDNMSFNSRSHKIADWTLIGAASRSFIVCAIQKLSMRKKVLELHATTQYSQRLFRTATCAC